MLEHLKFRREGGQYRENFQFSRKQEFAEFFQKQIRFHEAKVVHWT